MIHSHCHMLFHCLTLAWVDSSIDRNRHNGFFSCLLYSYPRPHIVLKRHKHHHQPYILVWDEFILGISLINSQCYLNQGFLVSCILTQGQPLFWKASNIITNHIYLCEMNLYWAVHWFTYAHATLLHDFLLSEISSLLRAGVWPGIPTMGFFLFVIFLPTANHCFRRHQVSSLYIYIVVWDEFILGRLLITD